MRETQGHDDILTQRDGDEREKLKDESGGTKVESRDVAGNVCVAAQ